MATQPTIEIRSIDVSSWADDKPPTLGSIGVRIGTQEMRLQLSEAQLARLAAAAVPIAAEILTVVAELKAA